MQADNSESFDQALSRTFIVRDGAFDLLDAAGTNLTAHGHLSQNASHAGLSPGTIIDNKYRLSALLGEGGMGAVYLAHHQSLDKDVALKTFRSAEIDADSWQRFELEVRAIAKLSHKNIVQVFDFGVWRGAGQNSRNMPFYTMEVLHGYSLAEHIRKATFSVGEVLEIFSAVADALAYAHRIGIVHRDIKPDNIFICDDGQIKLVDFGIAKLALDANKPTGGWLNELPQNVTQAGMVFGSPLYMSPEQSLGYPTDFRTDMYSFGCALFESLTGRPPFKGKTAFATVAAHQSQRPPTLSEVVPDEQFPRRLESLLSTLLAKDKAARPESFLAVKEDLASSLAAMNAGGVIGGRIRSRRKSENSVENEKAAAPEKTVVKALSLVGAFSLVAVVLAGLIAYGLTNWHFSSPTGVGPTQGIAASGTGKGAATGDKSGYVNTLRSGWNATVLPPPFRQRADDKTITFDFPYMEFIGFIGVDDTVHSKQALGKITLPRHQVAFTAEQPVYRDPLLLRGFAPDDLTSMGFDECGYYFNDKHLAEVSRLKGLERLVLKNCALNDASLKYIFALPNLHKLELDVSAVDGGGWARLPTLFQLDRIGIVKLSKITLLLRRLALSKKMRNIGISFSSIHEEDMGYLGQVSGLQRLNFFRCLGVDAAGVNKLRPLKELADLRIEGSHVGPECLDTLMSFPKLQELRIDLGDWSAEQKEKLADYCRRHHCNFIELKDAPPADGKE